MLKLLTCLLMMVVGADDLWTELHAPTEKEKAKVLEWIQEYEFQELAPDRSLVKANGVLAIKSPTKGNGAKIRVSEFSFAFANDLEKQYRRVIVAEDDAIREGFEVRTAPGLISMSPGVIDVLIERSGKRRVWCKQFGTELLSAENDPERKQAVMKSLFRRTVFNPRLAAFSSVYEQISAKSMDEAYGRFAASRLEGYRDTAGGVVARWFFPMRKEGGRQLDYSNGINRYIRFQMGVPVKVIDRVGPRDIEESIGRLYSVSEIKWKEMHDFQFPIHLESKSISVTPPGTTMATSAIELICDFDWSFDENVPDNYFSEQTVGDQEASLTTLIGESEIND